MAAADDSAGDEAETPAMARALAIRSIVAEIIVLATPVAPSRDLASMLQVSHAWREEALSEQRVWCHVHLVQRSVPPHGADFGAVTVLEVHSRVVPETILWMPIVQAARCIRRLSIPVPNGHSARQLSSDGAASLLAALPSELIELDVAGHWQAVTDSWLAQLAERCPRLTALDVSACSALHVVGPTLRTWSLVSLRMTRCTHIRLDDAAVISTIAAMPLTRLHGSCHARAALFHALSGCDLAKGLKELKLGSCYLEDADIEALGGLSGLECLDLSELNHNSLISTDALVTALRGLTSLRRLTLDGADGTVAFFSAAGSIVSLRTTLTYLEVRSDTERSSQNSESLSKLLTALASFESLTHVVLQSHGIAPGAHDPFRNLDALDVALALGAREAPPQGSDAEASEGTPALAGFASARWFHRAWLATPRMHAAFVYVALRRALAEARLRGDAHERVACFTQPQATPQEVDRPLANGQPLLEALEAAGLLTVSELEAVADRLGQPHRFVGLALALALMARTFSVLGMSATHNAQDECWLWVEDRLFHAWLAIEDPELATYAYDPRHMLEGLRKAVVDADAACADAMVLLMSLPQPTDGQASALDAAAWRRHSEISWQGMPVVQRFDRAISWRAARLARARRATQEQQEHTTSASEDLGFDLFD